MAGTLRELSPSKKEGSRRWEMRVFVGRDPDKTLKNAVGRVIKQGPPIYRSRVFVGGKRAASRALEGFVKEVRESEAKSVVGTTATVGKLLDEWLRNLERLGKAQSTLETYRTHVEKHIRPGLGSIRLDRLETHDVDSYLAQLDEKGLAPRTIKLDFSILSAALAQGVDWGWIRGNPAKRARLKSPGPAVDLALTSDQLRALYQAALAEDPDMAVTIALAAVTGCRRGELAGLRWEDLDVSRTSLRVQRAWVPGVGGQHLNETTKTGKGRTVFVGADGVALLQRYREAKRVQLGREPQGWLLSYDGGVTEMRCKSMTEYVSRLANKLGVPAHFHTLRHWAATELVHQGVDLPTAAAQLGHSTGVMADVYLHTSDERGSAAGNLIAAVVGKAIDAESSQRQ